MGKMKRHANVYKNHRAKEIYYVLDMRDIIRKDTEKNVLMPKMSAC